MRSRINCNHTEARLITNHCKNRSKSPLQCRTHVEEEIEQIHFSRCDFKPNLHVNRVSSVIRSYPLQFMQFILYLGS